MGRCSFWALGNWRGTEDVDNEMLDFLDYKSFIVFDR